MLQNIFGKAKVNEGFVSHLTPRSLNSESELLKRADDLAGQRLTNRVQAFSSAYPRAKIFLAGLGAISILYGVNKQAQSRKNRADTESRKERLSKPSVILTGADSQNPPFSGKNINEWLYRTVTISGRPIHGKGMMIPAKSYGLHGFEYLVPFVTKENEDGSVQEGLILNLGNFLKTIAKKEQNLRK